MCSHEIASVCLVTLHVALLLKISRSVYLAEENCMLMSCVKFTAASSSATQYPGMSLWPGTQTATAISHTFESLFEISLHFVATFEEVWLYWIDLMPAWLSEYIVRGWVNILESSNYEAASLKAVPSHLEDSAMVGLFFTEFHSKSFRVRWRWLWTYDPELLLFPH